MQYIKLLQPSIWTLMITLAILKLTGFLQLPWWVVMAPPLLLIAVVCLVMALFLAWQILYQSRALDPMLNWISWLVNTVIDWFYKWAIGIYIWFKTGRRQ